MLRISGGSRRLDEQGAAPPGRTLLLRVEGQVRGPWVDELRRACAEVLGQNGHSPHLVLDLAEVTFADADGLALLRELKSRRVELSNCSLFLTAQLNDEGHDDE